MYMISGSQKCAAKYSRYPISALTNVTRQHNGIIQPNSHNHSGQHKFLKNNAALERPKPVIHLVDRHGGAASPNWPPASRCIFKWRATAMGAKETLDCCA
jgi:hypothetical protein